MLWDLEKQTTKHRQPIVNIAQRLQDKGRQEGILQGIQQGRVEGKVEGIREAQISMARNLLKNGISLELIMESTNLSREELVSLQ